MAAATALSNAPFYIAIWTQNTVSESEKYIWQHWRNTTETTRKWLRELLKYMGRVKKFVLKHHIFSNSLNILGIHILFWFECLKVIFCRRDQMVAEAYFFYPYFIFVSISVSISYFTLSYFFWFEWWKVHILFAVEIKWWLRRQQWKAFRLMRWGRLPSTTMRCPATFTLRSGYI